MPAPTAGPVLPSEPGQVEPLRAQLARIKLSKAGRLPKPNNASSPALQAASASGFAADQPTEPERLPDGRSALAAAGERTEPERLPDGRSALAAASGRSAFLENVITERPAFLDNVATEPEIQLDDRAQRLDDRAQQLDDRAQQLDDSAQRSSSKWASAPALHEAPLRPVDSGILVVIPRAPIEELRGARRSSAADPAVASRPEPADGSLPPSPSRARVARSSAGHGVAALPPAPTTRSWLFIAALCGLGLAALGGTVLLIVLLR